VRYNEGIEVGVNKSRNENAKKVLDLIAKGYTLEDIQRELTSTVQDSNNNKHAI
jgi:SOS response regulatory protein OraA/RecX